MTSDLIQRCGPALARAVRRPATNLAKKCSATADSAGKAVRRPLDRLGAYMRKTAPGLSMVLEAGTLGATIAVLEAGRLGFHIGNQHSKAAAKAGFVLAATPAAFAGFGIGVVGCTTALAVDAASRGAVNLYERTQKHTQALRM